MLHRLKAGEKSRQMLHRRLVSPRCVGGYRYRVPASVSECGRVGGRCFAARPASFTGLRRPCLGELLLDLLASRNLW
jgi:hypothetical protein